MSTVDIGAYGITVRFAPAASKMSGDHPLLRNRTLHFLDDLADRHHLARREALTHDILVVLSTDKLLEVEDARRYLIPAECLTCGNAEGASDKEAARVHDHRLQ